MRIGIDARPLAQQQRTGIANYLYGLIQELPEIAPQHDYFLYSHRDVDAALADRCVSRRVDNRFGLLPGSLWLLSRVGELIRKDRLDVFWSTASVLPLWVPKNVFKVVTVYDLVWLYFPETMKRHNLWVHRLRAENAIRNCDRLITISQSTESDLVSTFGVAPERIRLVYPAISRVYKTQNQTSAAQCISRKYNVPPSYIAAVGTVEPRKNLTLLVHALQMLKRNGKLNCPLLIAGASGWKNSSLYEEVRKSELSEEDIRFLGYVPDEDLPTFYAGAGIFLFPSLYEGFGLPPLEAMACGTPVIASDARPMPEVLGDAAILESPSSAERFANAIIRLLGDEGLRRTMREKGLQRVEKFRPQLSAYQLLDAFGHS
jgi:glycosyltransferase involved in cell wall biosynthesis